VSSCSIIATLLLYILHNPISCGADGLLGDAHDVAVFLDHLVEDEEDGFSQSPAFVSETFCTFANKFYDDGTEIQQ
jgi:hypothetical protein